MAGLAGSDVRRAGETEPDDLARGKDREGDVRGELLAESVLTELELEGGDPQEEPGHVHAGHAVGALANVEDKQFVLDDELPRRVRVDLDIVLASEGGLDGDDVIVGHNSTGVRGWSRPSFIGREDAWFRGTCQPRSGSSRKKLETRLPYQHEECANKKTMSCSKQIISFAEIIQGRDASVRVTEDKLLYAVDLAMVGTGQSRDDAAQVRQPSHEL